MWPKNLLTLKFSCTQKISRLEKQIAESRKPRAETREPKMSCPTGPELKENAFNNFPRGEPNVDREYFQHFFARRAQNLHRMLSIIFLAASPMLTESAFNNFLPDESRHVDVVPSRAVPWRAMP